MLEFDELQRSSAAIVSHQSVVWDCVRDRRDRGELEMET